MAATEGSSRHQIAVALLSGVAARDILALCDCKSPDTCALAWRAAVERIEALRLEVGKYRDALIAERKG